MESPSAHQNFLKKPGRAYNPSSVDLRTRLFKAIYENVNLPSPIYELNFKELESALGVTRKTIIQMCYDIKGIFELDLTICRGGIRLGHRFYYEEQMRKDSPLKEAISEAFVAQLEKHRVRGLACGPGTTTFYCLKKLLNRKNLYREVVTNNLLIKDLLDNESHNPCILTGGVINRDINATLGRDGLDAFGSFKFDGGLIGVSGFNEKGELYVQYYEETEILEQIAKCVRNRIYIVAAIEKFTLEDTYKFCSLEELLKDNPDLEICVITTPKNTLDDAANGVAKAEKVLNMLRSNDRINLIIAEPEKKP